MIKEKPIFIPFKFTSILLIKHFGGISFGCINKNFLFMIMNFY